MDGVRGLRLSVLSRHFPDPDGTAAGRILYATCQGLLADGHEVSVCSWGPDAPESDLPAWCEWRRVEGLTGPLGRLRGLLRPRRDAARTGWLPAPGTIALADDPLSFPSVDGHSHSVVTLHYLTKLDAAATRRRSLADVQDRRAEARAARGAHLVLAYSERVGAALGVPSSFVPIAYPIPAEPLPPVEEPVAALLADWRWPPNRVALTRLLRLWPAVRELVPAARLLLAGKGLEGMGSSEGVRTLGYVADSREVLAQAAVVPFPAPNTSGPKVKILEAIASGIPVVTTDAGIEGLMLPGGVGAIVSSIARFGPELASLLGDPERRAAIGRAGREAAIAAHAPAPAARRRVAVLRDAFPDLALGGDRVR